MWEIEGSEGSSRSRDMGREGARVVDIKNGGREEWEEGGRYKGGRGREAVRGIGVAGRGK